MAFVPSHGEFRVNSQTGGDQLRPEVATLANGGFIVVWDDASGTLGDSSGRSIKAQLYDASGVAVGGEFLVNTQTTGDQVGPKVTGLSDGRFVVTWTDASGVSDGSLSSVQAQIFDAAGFRIGTEFVVNSQTSSSQSASDIAPWEGDKFVITWTDAVGDEVMARRYDASGTGFADFVVPDTTVNIQGASRVAALANGQFVITWEDTSGGSPFSQPADNSGYGIKAKNSGKFDFEFLVNTNTSGSQRFPDVAGLTDGSYVVAWQDQNSTSGDIKARIIEPGGPAGTSEFLVNTQTTGTQADAKITALADGGFVITWSDFSAGAPTSRRRRSTPRAQPSARSFSSIHRPHSTRRRLQSSGSPMVALSPSGPIRAARSVTAAGSASRLRSTSCSRPQALRGTTASRHCPAAIVLTGSAESTQSRSTSAWSTPQCAISATR